MGCQIQGNQTNLFAIEGCISQHSNIYSVRKHSSPIFMLVTHFSILWKEYTKMCYDHDHSENLFRLKIKENKNFISKRCSTCAKYRFAFDYKITFFKIQR